MVYDSINLSMSSLYLSAPKLVPFLYPAFTTYHIFLLSHHLITQILKLNYFKNFRLQSFPIYREEGPGT